MSHRLHIDIQRLPVSVNVADREVIDRDTNTFLFEPDNTRSYLSRITCELETSHNEQRRVYFNGGQVSTGDQILHEHTSLIGLSDLANDQLEIAILYPSTHDLASHINAANEKEFAKEVAGLINWFESTNPGNIIRAVTVIPMIDSRTLINESGVIIRPVEQATETIPTVEKDTIPTHYVTTSTQPNCTTSSSGSRWTPKTIFRTAAAITTIAFAGIATLGGGEKSDALPENELATPYMSPIPTFAPTTEIQIDTTPTTIIQEPSPATPSTTPPETQVPPTTPAIAVLPANVPGSNGQLLAASSCALTAEEQQAGDKKIEQQANLCNTFVQLGGRVDTQGNGVLHYSRDIGNSCVAASIRVQGASSTSRGSWSNRGDIGIGQVACR